MTRLTAAQVLDHLQMLAERGLLRRLDVAFARFVVGLAGPAAPPELPMAAACLSRAEGQGHSCWPLGEPAADDAPDAAALRTALAPVLAGLPPTDAWAQALTHCAVVDAGDAIGEGSAPLVLADANAAPRLYLRRYWHYEQALISAVRSRVTARDDAVQTPVDGDEARRWLDRLFGPPDAAAAVDWQRLACALALRGRLTLITGGPGTGKTYTAARALALLLAQQSPEQEAAQPLRVALAAPTGKAAARLAQSLAQAWQDLAAGLSAEPAVQARVQAWAVRIGPPRTLHALLGARPDTRHFRFDAHHPLPVDVLVVDEASMVHLELMVALLQALPPTARLILLGDKDQLSSVEAGAVLGDLCRDAEAGGYAPQTAEELARLTGQALPARFIEGGVAHPVSQQTVMLRESRRFGGPIGRLAAAVNEGDVATARRWLQGHEPAVTVLQPQGQLSLLADSEPNEQAGREPAGDLLQRLTRRVIEGVPAVGGDAATAVKAARVGSLQAVYALISRGPEGPDEAAHQRWVAAVLAGFDGCRVLAALRDGPWGVAGLNQALQSALAQAGWINPTAGAQAGWYVGRPVLVTRNDAAAGVFNGDVGLALPRAGVGRGSPGDPLRVWFADGSQLRSVLASRLAHVETAFAMTVHKSQGSEFAHTVLVLPPRPSPVLSRELLYTGITRARQALTLVLPGEGVFEAAIGRRTMRASGLAHGLGTAPAGSEPM